MYFKKPKAFFYLVDLFLRKSRASTECQKSAYFTIPKFAELPRGTKWTKNFETLGIFPYLYQLSNETSSNKIGQLFPKSTPLPEIFDFRPVRTTLLSFLKFIYKYTILLIIILLL